MKRADHKAESFQKVSVCGITCQFSGMRIARETVPKGKYQYEVAGDDESGSGPAKVKSGILVNFFGTLVCDRPLPIGDGGVLWHDDGDPVWL